mmetsp:Transcript_16204/g.23824  ORF Transcript_16204/g.23824 Transcript_16204/m.23824 type:complete len:113 (+) Transcript_16204:746-1084(+)
MQSERSKKNAPEPGMHTHCEVPVETVGVPDVMRASDCFLAGFVCGFTKEYSYKECLETAAKGSTESAKHTCTCALCQLAQEDIEYTIVFTTNRVFDTLHIGHFKLLKHTKKH